MHFASLKLLIGESDGTFKRWQIPMVALCFVGFIATIGTLFFIRGQQLMQEQLKERLKSTATAAAMQFNAKDVEGIRTQKDVKKTSYRMLTERLLSIKESIPNVRFAYIMRKSSTPDMLEFVADADAALSKEQLDTNKNGVIDEDEEASLPGDVYDPTGFPVLQEEAFLRPAVDEEVNKDQWGYIISGYAPIVDARGNTVGILGLDMDAEEYISLSQSIFSPVAFLLLLLAGVTFGFSVFLILSKRRLEAIEKLENERSGVLRLAFHQLGGPLSIIKWSLELLKEEKEKSVSEIFTTMDEGVRRLNAILDSLKDADLVHEHKIAYKPEPASLCDVVRDVVKEFTPRLVQAKLDVHFDMDCDMHMKLDKKLIAGVVRELLANAIGFSKPGGSVIIRTTRHNNFARTDIEDFGCGIPSRDVGRVFDEFVRGSNATIYKPDGNGLGLYIVKGIIEKAGGKIWLKSREGQGTTVSFTLPIV